MYPLNKSCQTRFLPGENIPDRQGIGKIRTGTGPAPSGFLHGGWILAGEVCSGRSEAYRDRSFYVPVRENTEGFLIRREILLCQ